VVEFLYATGFNFSDLQSGYSAVECVGISMKYRAIKRQGKVVPSP
jgi:hypothetical protein